jgi:hypothetical protein
MALLSNNNIMISGLRHLRERQKIRSRLRLEIRPGLGLFPKSQILSSSLDLVVQHRARFRDDGFSPNQQSEALVFDN